MLSLHKLRSCTYFHLPLFFGSFLPAIHVVTFPIEQIPVICLLRRFSSVVRCQACDFCQVMGESLQNRFGMGSALSFTWEDLRLHPGAKIQTRYVTHDVPEYTK